MLLVGKAVGERSLESSRSGWEDKIKMDLQEWDGSMDWINLAQNRDR